MLDEQNFNLNGSNQRMMTARRPAHSSMVNFLIAHSAGIINTQRKAYCVLIAAVILMLSAPAFLLSESKPEVKVDPRTGYPVNQYVNPAYR